jgi:excinuclease UvrABC nuclease subunit
MSAPNRIGRRFFVYFLSDATGELLYVGRSCQPVQRLKNHIAEASNPDNMEATRKALWLADVRRVDMIGPFHFGEATIRERELIRLAQPYGNLRLNPRAYARGWNAKQVTAA